MDVAIGVDPHRSTLAAGALDPLGRNLGSAEFRNDPKGHQEFLGWIAGMPGEVKIGLECTGSYAAMLTATLFEHGFDPREVPANLTRREARRDRKGKCDGADALAIARVVAREGDALPSPRRVPRFVDLRLLCDHRDQLVHRRTKLVNQLHKDLVVLRPGYERELTSVKNPKGWSQVIKLLRGDRSLRADLVRERIAELRGLQVRIKTTERKIEQQVAATGTTLTLLPGIGFMLAARILGEVGDITRFRSSAAFASMAGVAPLPASSGLTTRHRYNRHGNRKLNYALYMFAVVSCRCNPESRAYVDRKKAEGKTSKEALRCLKRRLSDVVYRRMMSDLASLEEAA